MREERENSTKCIIENNSERKKVGIPLVKKRNMGVRSPRKAVLPQKGKHEAGSM